ncbi:MAG: alpha-1,4-glucan--maltose-1-phosphate maltosyltransferase [Chthoniobacterales bacterium]
MQSKPSLSGKRPDTVVIEHVAPDLNGNRYPVKRIQGDTLTVEADIFKDGHDVVYALLKWRRREQASWNETPMQSTNNPADQDRWRATLPLPEPGLYEYTIEAWGDHFASWVVEFSKKFDAGLRELNSEIFEGAAFIEAAAKRAQKSPDAKTLATFAKELRRLSPEAARQKIDEPVFQGLMKSWPDRSLSTECAEPFLVRVERERAAFGAWYEFFPRSAEGKADSGSTFRDCIGRIEDAKAMGFNVIYFPPIHPIGVTNRKGRNNSLKCEPGDPGVPYAIGNSSQGVNGGGHKDVAPELGTLDDFCWLVDETKKRGLEIAIDFAINCSPDHPYVKEHPEWFFKRPDGSIKYAENPPKKYEDVYPLNFYNENWKELWIELRNVILFWCEQGVRIFRVDNPHTKPVTFWEWMIAEVQDEFPDAIFLSEAFTKAKMMRVLAKAGFTQSYTYFTWRNEKQEIIDYFTELTQTEMVDYFRPNLFTNTPDILPFCLQEGGRPAFRIRALLAATLGATYGIYSGFELCENAALPGREEYLDSEKYQFKGRDWDAPDNIKDVIFRLNQARSTNRALQQLGNLRFLETDNDAILAYYKATPSKDNIVIVVTSLDYHNPRSGWVQLPLDKMGIQDNKAFQVEDLLTDERFTWHSAHNFVELDPWVRPSHVFRLRRWQGREGGQDLFL